MSGPPRDQVCRMTCLDGGLRSIESSNAQGESSPKTWPPALGALYHDDHIVYIVAHLTDRGRHRRGSSR
jgi:hypothetical protein